jgi:Domain of unknown function (DUF4879)
MMKKGILISLLILCLVFSATVFGESSTSGDTSSINTPSLLKQPLLTDQKIAEFVATIQPYLKSIQKTQTGNSTLEQSASLVTPMASAAPLTYLQVISTQHPTWEYFTADQLSSVADHGGAEMYIATIEVGYGYPRFAHMNGSLVQLLNTSPDPNPKSYDLDNDGIIDTFVYFWNVSGYNNGTFSYQSTSQNSPWNTMSDSISIR